MSLDEAGEKNPRDVEKTQIPDHTRDVELGSDSDSLQKGDVLSLEHVDPVLNAKMHLVNNVCHSPRSNPWPTCD